MYRIEITRNLLTMCECEEEYQRVNFPQLWTPVGFMGETDVVQVCLCGCISQITLSECEPLTVIEFRINGLLRASFHADLKGYARIEFERVNLDRVDLASLHFDSKQTHVM